MKMLLTAFAAILVAPAAAEAAIVDLAISGIVTGDRFANGDTGFGTNSKVLQTFLASYALGTEYSFTFSYDTDTRPTNLFGRYATYSNLPIGGAFSLGGASTALTSANFVVGQDTMFRRERFAVFGNADGPWGKQFAGFSVIDFSFETTSANPIGPGLPGDVTLAANIGNYARVRFVREGVGETGVLFSIDRLTRSGAAVPEPASWVMMIVGFGVAGAALRRRERRRSVA